MSQFKVSRNFISNDKQFHEDDVVEMTVADADLLIKQSKAAFPDRGPLLVRVDKEAVKAAK